MTRVVDWWDKVTTGVDESSRSVLLTFPQP